MAPIATIKCIYPGASPEDIEKLIVKPIEDEVGEIAEIKRIESFSMDSIGVLKVTLKDMSDARIDKAWDELKDKVDDAAAVLPANARTPVLDTDLSSTYGVIFGIASEDYSYEMLSLAANRPRDELRKESGVKAVDIKGEIGMEVDINLDMAKLEQYGVSPISIATALKARNINIPGGNLEIGQVKTPVKVSGEYADIDEIENTIVAVSSETGTPVYLKNVAEVVKSEETREVFSKVNNKKALLIGVKYMDGQDMTAISDRINAVVDEFTADSLYDNMELIRITDQADFVKCAIALFQENLASAIILVVLAVLLTMGIRSALVVSLPIPIVMAMVFIY
ncbi:MAG TPA: efflux RND transporter permease subunit [Negativicutes bacterium]|nr:efflux RND transporter permease subunit [Negativicutes bacterium]